MKKIVIAATTLIFVSSFASVSSASEDSGSTQTSTRAVNDQITDSVTQFKSTDQDANGITALAEGHVSSVTDLSLDKVETNSDKHAD